jgi:hypothetical protein
MTVSDDVMGAVKVMSALAMQGGGGVQQAEPLGVGCYDSDGKDP